MCVRGARRENSRAKDFFPGEVSTAPDRVERWRKIVLKEDNFLSIIIFHFTSAHDLHHEYAPAARQTFEISISLFSLRRLHIAAQLLSVIAQFRDIMRETGSLKLQELKIKNGVFIFYEKNSDPDKSMGWCRKKNIWTFLFLPSLNFHHFSLFYYFIGILFPCHEWSRRLSIWLTRICCFLRIGMSSNGERMREREKAQLVDFSDFSQLFLAQFWWFSKFATSRWNFHFNFQALAGKETRCSRRLLVTWSCLKALEKLLW